MAATCAIVPSSDPVAAGAASPWIEHSTELRFLFAGLPFHTATMPAMLLNAPFPHMPRESAQLLPPPEPFARAGLAARIFAWPMTRTRRHIVLLPGAIRYVVGQARHFYIDLSGSFAGYLRKFSPRSRRNLARIVRVFRRQGGSAEPLCEFSRPEEMEQFHGLASEVSVRTYQHRILEAGLPDSAEFRRDLIRRAARGRVRGYVLMLGGRPAAFLLCQITGTTLTGNKTGFDPRLARLSPGKVMFYLVFERLFAAGRYRVFDWGCGDFFYKEFFATGHVWCGDILYLPRTARTLALAIAHHGLDRVCEGLKALLDVFGLRARAKKLIHYGICRVS